MILKTGCGTDGSICGTTHKSQDKLQSEISSHMKSSQVRVGWVCTGRVPGPDWCQDLCLLLQPGLGTVGGGGWMAGRGAEGFAEFFLTFPLPLTQRAAWARHCIGLVSIVSILNLYILLDDFFK